MNNKNQIFRSIAIIEERIQEKLTVENIADSVHFSKCHYQRLFREVVGDSVMRYVTKHRLSMAAGELAETDLTILEIALKYGFESHEGFTRSFRAYMGVAPSEYRAAFEPICDRYDALAQDAQIKADRIANFFKELCSLIFRDMRDQAKEKLQKAVAQGRTAANRLLNDPGLPYNYIADSITEIADELSLMPLEEVTVSLLEDYLFRLDVIASAADMDALRMPAHKELFGGISDFRVQLGETAVFFQSLLDNAVQTFEEPEKSFASDLAFQGNLLSFYLKGEIQKLEPNLSQSQKATLGAICEKMGMAVQQAGHEADAATVEDITKIFKDVYEKMTAEAEKLGIYGGYDSIYCGRNQTCSPLRDP